MTEIRRFLKSLKEQNLATWYLLPLLDMNRDAFVSSNFINAWLVENTSMLAVEVIDWQICKEMVKHSLFLRTKTIGGSDYMMFSLAEWKQDVKLFSAGKYSEMSEAAKHMIYDRSGLAYKQQKPEGVVTDAVLMALEKNSVLLEKWSQLLDVSPDVLLDVELMILPSSSMVSKEFLI